MSEENIISVRILDRSYSIKCPQDEEKQLQASAKFVDDQMRLVRQSGTINSTERVAVVTALNLAHELLLLKKQKSEYVDEVRDRVDRLQNKIENFLATEEEIAV